MSKIPILVIAGPTASGKTALAIELAILYNGEIISADSMQIYKGMDIATAKPTKEEMKGIPHHLMGFLDRDKDFSVADYLALAREKIAEISNKGKLPVIAGGTGLYISSLLDNVKFDQSPGKSEIREKLLKETEKFGREAMLQRLFEVDEETAKTLHPNNINRIIRALEVYELTGIKMSEHKVMSRCEESPYNACVIGLNFAQRELLYDRINKRVDIMVQKGLVEEAFEIYKHGGLKTAHQAIGYKELIPYFKGEEPLEACIEKIKQETRRYAKRQLTWFRRDERINWIIMDENTIFENIIDNSKKIIANSISL